MFIETSQIIPGSKNIFVSFEHTDKIQFSSIIFHYHSYSILTNTSDFESNHCWVIILGVLDIFCPKNDRSSNSSTD